MTVRAPLTVSAFIHCISKPCDEVVPLEWAASPHHMGYWSAPGSLWFEMQMHPGQICLFMHSGSSCVYGFCIRCTCTCSKRARFVRNDWFELSGKNYSSTHSFAISGSYTSLFAHSDGDYMEAHLQLNYINIIFILLNKRVGGKAIKKTSSVVFLFNSNYEPSTMVDLWLEVGGTCGRIIHASLSCDSSRQ